MKSSLKMKPSLKMKSSLKMVINECFDEPEHITLDHFLKCPFISTYYINTKPMVNEDIIINFYSTNWAQEEYYDDKKLRLKVIVKKQDQIIEKLTNGGDDSINIGSFFNTGEQYITLEVQDLDNHLYSAKEIIQFYVIDENYIISESETYRMTKLDLINYGIDNTNNEDESIRINNSLNITRFLNEKKELGFRKVVLYNETGSDIYRIDPQGNRNNCIIIPSGLTLDGNNVTIKQHVYYDPNGGGSSCIVSTVKDAFDTHLNNLKIEGDYDTHDLGPRYKIDENGNQIQINASFEAEGFNGLLFGGAFCSCNNCEMSLISGYALGGGSTSNHSTSDLKYDFEYFKSINLKTGEVEDNNNCCISAMVDIAKFDGNTGWLNPQNALDYKFLLFGAYLGYSGLIGITNIAYLCYYDENQNYIGYSKIYQHVITERPNNVKYIRAMCLATNSNEMPQTGKVSILALNYMSNTSIEFNNFYAHDTRSCLTYPSFNRVRFNNCKFSYIAKEEKYQVTKLFFDNEDGSWYCNNFYFENCINENRVALGGVNVVHGLNYIFKNNVGVDLRMHQCKGLYVNHDCDIYLANKVSGHMSRYFRCENVEFTKEIQLLDDGNYPDTRRAFKNCKLDALNISTNKNSPQFINCIYDDTRLSQIPGDILQRYIAGNHRNTKFICKTAKYIPNNSIYNGSLFEMHNKFNDFSGIFSNIKVINMTDNLLSIYPKYGLIYDSEFDGMSVLVNVKMAENKKIVFYNCVFNNVTKLLSTADFNYTIGTYSNIIFNNCVFNCKDSNKYFIDIYAKPVNATYTFKNCSINNYDINKPLITGLYNDFTLQIANTKIIFDNTFLEENQKILPQVYVDNEIDIEIIIK